MPAKFFCTILFHVNDIMKQARPTYNDRKKLTGCQASEWGPMD